MTFYDHIYPFYPLQRTSFIFSDRLLTVILVFVWLAVALLLILPGIRGKSRLFWMCRIIISFFIGAVIVSLNFTNDWAEGSVTTNTSYKSFSNVVVNADIGLHVGLYGINVTLRGKPVIQFNETINYNEMFSWYDIMDDEYEKALKRGLPIPILYIAEKFTVSSACGIIFQYRSSGRYASATLWTAFCCYLLSNILLSMPVVPYAAYMMLATAVFIFVSMATFSTIMNVPHCVFSIGSDSFVAQFSRSFWLALATGVLCSIVGGVLLLFPEKMKESLSCDDADDDDDDDRVFHSEGYVNSVFVDGVTISPMSLKPSGEVASDWS